MASKYCRSVSGDGDGPSPNPEPGGSSIKKVKERRKSKGGADIEEFFSRRTMMAKKDDFITEEKVNPLLNDKVLEVLFSKLSFNDLRNCRYVSRKWDQMAIKALTKLMKPVKFLDPSDLQDKKGNLEHMITNMMNHNLFISFKFDIKSLLIQQTEALDRFFNYYQPQSIEFSGHDKDRIALLAQKYGISPSGNNHRNFCLQDNLFVILKKAAGSIVDLSIHFDTTTKFLKPIEDKYKLSSIIFPHLETLSIRVARSPQFDFYSKLLQRCIGPNAPHLKALKLESLHFKDEKPFMDLFTKTGLAIKLEYFEVFNIDHKLLNGLAQLGLEHHLKLKSIKYWTTYSEISQNWIKSTVNFMGSQSNSVEYLEFRYLNSDHQHQHQQKHNNRKMRENVELESIQFPSMKMVTKFHINDLKIWSENFKSLNFASTFPQLIEFTTYDIKNILTVCSNGYSILKLQMRQKKDLKLELESPINFIQFEEIFSNLEFLELSAYSLPEAGFPDECISFWMRLKRVVVHFQLENFLSLNLLLLKALKELHIVINTANNLAFHNYLPYLANLTIDFEQKPYLYATDSQLYTKFMMYISDARFIQPSSVRVRGFRIASTFKNDFKNIFPNCCFTETKGHLI